MASSTSTPLFRILTPAATSAAADHAARLGLLALPGSRGPPLPTPAFVAVASRGAVPHVTPDNAVRHGLFAAAYLALEDFVEKFPLQPDRTPPILATPLSPASSSSSFPTSRLHAFCALPPSALSVLAPRRHPTAAAHLGNGPSHISVVTSTGFQKLTLHAYHDAVDALQPDIVVPMADLTYGGGEGGDAGVSYPTAKRATRMAERSEDWVGAFLSRAATAGGGGGDGDGSHGPQSSSSSSSSSSSKPYVFAPTLPVPYAMQWQYLNRLAEWMTGEDQDGHRTACETSSADENENRNRNESEAATPLAGLAVYDADLLPDLRADYACSLALLPRLSLHPAPTPHQMLRHIALGADVLVLPGITAASEAGLAYTFAWTGEMDSRKSASESAGDKHPLAVDLADPAHAASLQPLAPGCTCAACAAGHHRAYVHHLLDAREMLAWTLLQLHNHHVVARLLEGVRATLAEQPAGVASFEAARRRFHATYAPDLPSGSAVRPRARGYQAVSDGPVESRLNKPAWGRLEEVSDKQQ